MATFNIFIPVNLLTCLFALPVYSTNQFQYFPFTMHHSTLTSWLMNSTSITSRNRLNHSYAKRKNIVHSSEIKVNILNAIYVPIYKPMFTKV